MEGMLMLLVMMIITMVLTWALNGEQRKRAVSLLLCAAMMSPYIPAINVARADSIAKPVLVNEQVLVNGTKVTQIGAVTYSASGSAYTLDTSSARVRVKNGDSISFDGAISAPEGETISWVRVDVYDANTEEPYTVGAEYYRASGMKVQEFDLASIPALTIGEAFGSKDYTLVEGGKYIVMFCVGDSNGNTFVDTDANIEDDQGPAILVDVKLSPSNCKHPHSDYRYVRHSSGEIRNANYGDALTHQVESLYERYCGLCDSFLMNIWGQGTSEEHNFGNNGVCLACGYYAAPMMMSNGLQTTAIEGDITITEAKYIDEEGISVFWDCSNNACMYFRIEASIGGDVIFEETRKRNLTGSQNVLIPYDDLIRGEECEIYIEGIAENSVNAEAITEGDTVYVDIPEGEFLNITDPSNCELEFGAEEESQMIYFEASGRWTAECDDDWVTLSKTSGGSDIVAIEVTVDANDGDVGVERETSIYIALSSGSLEEEIYVYQEGREMTNYEKFQAAVDDLEIDYASGDSEDAVTADVGLPEMGLYGVTISWESSNTSIIDDEGIVVRPDEDTEVELTATLSYYQYTEEKVFYLTVLADENAVETIELSADKTEINAGDSVTFTAQSNADSVTLYIEAYNEAAGEWYVAVTKEMTKNGSEFTYTHEFANAGSKRVYAKTANGTTSDTIEITANALKETLEAPVGGTMAATVGEEVEISWGAVANATGYTAHLYEMVDGKLESIGDVTDLIEGTSLKYTFSEAGEYHVGVTATAEGYNPSEQSAVIVTVEEEAETITLSADKTEINAGDSVTFTAQSNADSVTLYIEAYNEAAGEWYVAVTKEMTKNGSEFIYTHEFANAGSKRVYAETANGTTSDTIEITANALKETLEAPVGGTMTATVGEEVEISWGAVANATGYTAHLYEMVDCKLESIGDVTDLIEGTSLKYTFTEAGEYHVGVTATAEGYNPSEQSAVIVTVEEEAETITLSADKTEINTGDSVTFTAQSNADSVTLYIEAYNEVAGEWYVAVTKEMTKNGSEFTYTHEFANAGSKRVYAKTANGTTSDTIEITANALKETLEAPVGGTMTATVGEEVTISWGATANATGYTAHLYEMVDGKLESIGDVTDLIEGTSLKYTFTEAGEYHVGVIATAEGYNPSEQSAVIVTVEEEADTITLSADKTEINAGDSVTFTAQSNADSVTLYIEAYNEVAGEWYVAVTKEMTKNGSEFTYTHEFSNAGSKRVYAKTANGTASDTIEITANALKETLEAPVGGTMTATVGEEVEISWGAVANATGYTAHLYEMVDGKLESIGDVTNLISGTYLKYTFTEAGEYHVGVTATAEGYNPSEQSAVIVTVKEKQCDHSNIIWKEETVCEPLPENTAEYHTHHAVVVTKHAYCNDCDVTDPLDDLYPPQEVSRNNDLHQLTDGDCLLCGYEATFVPECEHNNKVIDESTIVVEKQTETEHTISYWYFCNDCQTLLNNVAREENTAAHTFNENDVCTVCGYTKNSQNLPTMTFTVNKPVVNAGEEVEFTFTMTGGSPMANKVMLYAEDKYILTVGPNEEYNFDSNPEIGVYKWTYKFNQAGVRKIHFVPLYENTEKTEHVEGVPTAAQEIRVDAYLNLLMSGVPQDTTTRKIALTVYDNGGSGTPITVDSNVDWSVKTDASWIKLTADTANKQILHEYEVNNTGVARVGTITVSAPGCEDWVITCTQETVPLTWGMWTDGSYVKIQASGSAMNPNHKYIAHVYRDGYDKCLKEVELEEALSEFHYYYGFGVVRGTTYRVQIEEKDANGTTLRTSGVGTFKFGLYATLNNIKSGSVNVTNTKEITAGDSISFEWDGSLGLDAYVYAVINGTRITLHNGKAGTSAVTETISASQYEHLLTSDRTKIDIYVEVESLKKSWSGSIVKKQNSENYDVWYRFTGENDQSDHKASGTIYVNPDWVDYITIWAANDSGEWIQPKKYAILSAQKDEYYFEVHGDTEAIKYDTDAQGFLVKSEGSATVRIMQNNKLIVSVDVVVGARSSGGLNIDGNQYYVKLKYTDDNGKMNSLEYGKAATSGASFGRFSQIRTMRDSVNVELEIVNANGYGLSVYDFTELYWTVQGDFVQGQGDNFTLQLPWVMTPDNGARYTFTLKQKQTLADKELIKFDVDVLYSDEFFERYSLYSDDLVFGDRYALEMGVDAYTVLHQSAREVTFKCKDNLTGEFKQINSYDGRNKFGVKAEWGLEKTDGCSFLFQGTGVQTITLYRGNAGPLALPVASLKIAILDSQPTLQENLLDFEKNIVQAQNYFEAEKASDLRNEINNSIDALGKDIEDAVSFIDPNKRYASEAEDIFDADNIEYIMYLNRTGGLGHSAVLLTDERGNSLIVSFYPDENAVWGEKVHNTGETRMRYLSAFETYNLVYGENGGELSDLYERNTAAGGNLMSNNYWNSYGYRTEEAYTRGSVKAVDNNTGRSMYDTCIGLFSKETKYNAIWQNCDDVALSIFAENWYELENIEGRIPNLTPGQTFSSLESLGYESLTFGSDPASALPFGIIQLHNSATRTDNHIPGTAVNVVDAVVRTFNDYDEYFVERLSAENIFDQEEAQKYFGEEFYKKQLTATLDSMYPATGDAIEEINRVKNTAEAFENAANTVDSVEIGDAHVGGMRALAKVTNQIVGYKYKDNFIEEEDIEFFEKGASLTKTAVDATNHIADSCLLLLTETEERIETLERIKVAAMNSGNQELADSADVLINEYKNKQETIAVELSNAFIGWAANETLENLVPPYKTFTTIINAGDFVSDTVGLTESAEAHEAAIYGNSIEYSIMLGCMADIETKHSSGEAVTEEEWKDYYVMAEYTYTSRINQINTILESKYLDGTERTRLTHAKHVLEDGLHRIKANENK